MMSVFWFIIAVLWFIGLQICVFKNLDKLDKALDKRKKEINRFFRD